MNRPICGSIVKLSADLDLERRRETTTRSEREVAKMTIPCKGIETSATSSATKKIWGTKSSLLPCYGSLWQQMFQSNTWDYAPHLTRTAIAERRCAAAAAAEAAHFCRVKQELGLSFLFDSGLLLCATPKSEETRGHCEITDFLKPYPLCVNAARAVSPP